MTQTIIALFIVAIALVWVLVRVFRTAKGKQECNCGCAHCPTSKKRNCHIRDKR